MCGLAGALGVEDDVGAELVRAMMDAQIHRGPDARGQFVSDGIALGHTRLCVIDPSQAGRQPMQTPDGRLVLVYNGEVYNFRQLRDTLRDRDHRFGSDTDSEVILHAWAEWGEAALHHIEGMYAFAMWDRHSRSLHLVRDRLGIKPLYWHYDGAGRLVFASEVRALLASGSVQRALDRAALPAFLSQQTVPTPRTLVKGVRMVPPGTRLQITIEGGKAGAPQVLRYWDPVVEASAQQRQTLANIPRREAVQGLRKRLEAAVARRLTADVPLGAFLSGGVDSTAVVGLMSRASETPVRTFTVAFEETGYEDASYARLAAKQLKTDHTEIRFSDEELLASVPQAVASQDHPSGDGINTWIVSRGAKEAGLTVALSGLGGDELFGGYSSFRRLPALERTRTALSTVPRLARIALGRVLRSVRPGVASDKIAALLCTDGSVAEAYPVLRSVFGPEWVEDLLSAEPAGEAVLDPSYTSALREAFSRYSSASCLVRVSLAELTCYMRDVLLRDTDQMSMAHSLEVRVPFLDRDLVEYALALPDEVREPSIPPKRYLIEAVQDLLPESVANRPKSGFTMPFERWMRGPLKSFCNDGIQALASHPAFRAKAVHRVWTGFLAGDRRWPWSRPWLLIALGHWLERENLS